MSNRVRQLRFNANVKRQADRRYVGWLCQRGDTRFRVCWLAGRITDPVAGPLFAGENVEGDQASGTIYVLRSKSDHPVVAANRDVLHKIGVTWGDVARRIVNAKLDPTFLMADVEIVATYQLYNINRTRLENLIHRIFDAARLDIEIKDRFGLPVIPREWFLVPLSVVDEAIEKIRDGTITSYTYDPKAALLRRRDAGNEQAARR